jgi:hypothetical protein
MQQKIPLAERYINIKIDRDIIHLMAPVMLEEVNTDEPFKRYKAKFVRMRYVRVSKNKFEYMGIEED